MRLIGAVAIVSLAAPSVRAGDEAQDCSLATPELHRALDVVHAGRDGSVKQAKAAVKSWLPRTTQVLAAAGSINKQWFHLAVDLSGQLVRLERTDEARVLLARVSELDAKGEWGPLAAQKLKALEPSQ